MMMRMKMNLWKKRKMVKMKMERMVSDFKWY